MGHKQVVTCVSGGFTFSLPSSHLAGVYQLPREQMGQELDVAETPEGKMRVVSARKLFAQELGFELSQTTQERDLVAVRADNETVALRVENVSRPSAVAPNGWHQLPKIALPNDPRGIISAIATLDPKAENPNDAFALVVDTFAALELGRDTQMVPTNTLPGAINAVNAPDQITPQRRGSGQLLAFVPEDVPRQDLNFVFCLPLAAVAEVSAAFPAFESPLNNDLFEGYILWRKMPVPVINMGACFGLKENVTEKRERSRGRRLVVARASGHRYVAFYTQTQMHSMKTPPSTKTQFESMAGRPLLGAFKTNFGSMVIPNLDKILDGEL